MPQWNGAQRGAAFLFVFVLSKRLQSLQKKKKETVLISDFFDYATKVHKIKTLSLEKNSVGLLPSRNKVLGG